MRNLILVNLAVIALISQIAIAEDLTLQLPEGAKVSAATIKAFKSSDSIDGKIDGKAIHFAKLLPLTKYDVTLTLADGRVLQGVNMGWLDEEKVDPKNDPMSADDQAEIKKIVETPNKDFFNKIDLMLLAGDKNRAIGLVRQIRDTAFHSDKGGEVISRWEVWYFRFEAGGWEKVTQAQEVLRRDRFPSQAEYEKTMKPVTWVPEIGGIKLAKGESKSLTLTWPPAGASATGASMPTSQPSTDDPMP